MKEAGCLDTAVGCAVTLMVGAALLIAVAAVFLLGWTFLMSLS